MSSEVNKMIVDFDMHTHTNLSLCAWKEATLDLYTEKAKEFGIKKMAITNHLWDSAVEGACEWYVLQNFEHIAPLKKEIEEKNKSGEVKFFFGAEGEYSYKYRRPAITPSVAEQLEILLVPNSHTHMVMPKEFIGQKRKHAEFMLDAFTDIVKSDVAKYITAIPHPFSAVNCDYSEELFDFITDDEYKRCFDIAAEKGIGIEINPNFIKGKTLPESYALPMMRMYRIAKECGCKFTIGTDSHKAADFDAYPLLYIFCSVLDLRENDFHRITK